MEGGKKGSWSRSGLLSHGRLSGLLEARLQEEELQEDFAALEKRLRFIAWWEEGYPGRLPSPGDRPAGLFVRGTLPARDRFTAAIVGARSCPELGRQTAGSGWPSVWRRLASGDQRPGLGIDGRPIRARWRQEGRRLRSWAAEPTGAIPGKTMDCSIKWKYREASCRNLCLGPAPFP